METYIQEYFGLDITEDPRTQTFRVYDEAVIVSISPTLQEAKKEADRYLAGDVQSLGPLPGQESL
jgi:hypothetical protein